LIVLSDLDGSEEDVWSDAFKAFADGRDVEQDHTMLCEFIMANSTLGADNLDEILSDRPLSPQSRSSM